MSLSTQHPIPSESDRLSTDNELVVQARAGDSLAFEELFERYNERICLYLIHMVGNDAVGCELTQETFLKAWQALPGFREEARFVTGSIASRPILPMIINAVPGSFAGFPGRELKSTKVPRR